MLQSEFENLWGARVDPRFYHDVIEPMYLAVPETMGKDTFVNLIKRPQAREGMAYEGCGEDKARFVRNLGDLLAQTRTDVESCQYIRCLCSEGEEYVKVKYRDGHTDKICITADSYVAIIRDVTRYM